MTRRREYDVVRGLAIVFMIAVHVMFTSYDFSCAALTKVVDFLGSAPAAPVFMFLMGCNIVDSKHNSPGELIRRGFKLFALSYVFNAVCHSLPHMVAGYDYAVPMGWLVATDILTFAGLAFMVIGLAKKAKLTPAMLLIAAICLNIFGNALNVEYPISLEDNFAVASICGLVYNASETAYFPLFTWLVYPAAGIFFADMLKKAKDEDTLWKNAGITSAIVFAAMFTTFCLVPEINAAYYADEFVYYNNGLFWVVHNMSFVIAWISLWHFICKRFKTLGSGLFLVMSKNLTKAYVMQWLFIGIFLIIPFGNEIKLGTIDFLTTFVAITLLSVLVSKYSRI